MVLGPMTFGTTAATPVLTGPPGFLCLSGGRWNFLTNPNRRLPGSKNGGKNAQSNLLEAKNMSGGRPMRITIHFTLTKVKR